jgi:polyhydroxyalkanoate synthesis regulator phasin
MEWNKGISGFVKSYEGDLTKLQKSWWKNTERIGETLTDTYEELTEGYGEIYNNYLERTAPYFMNMNNFSKSRVKELETEITDLKKRIAKLEAKKR